MFTPFVIFGPLRMGAFFFCGATLTNRTGPVGPNRHTLPTRLCAEQRQWGQGGGICCQWPKATMRRQGRRETPACEVYPNRRRVLWSALTAPWSDQEQAREAGAVRAPWTLRVRGVGSHARVSPAAPAMPGTYRVCVAAPYALFFASLRFI